MTAEVAAPLYVNVDRVTYADQQKSASNEQAR
jgi:hypothetical protein